MGFLFIPLDLRFFYSRIWEFSFLHVPLELWFFLFFSILAFCLNWFEYLKCMTKQSIFFLFYPCFFFSFSFHFFTTHQLRPINANFGKCPWLSVPLQMQVHVTTRIISKGFNSSTRWFMLFLSKKKGYGSTCLVFDQRIILLSSSYTLDAS